MKLFENSIIYAPETEGGTGSSVNIASQSKLSAQELAGLQADLETMEDEKSPAIEGEPELDIDSLGLELNNLVTQRIEESKPSFEVNEDGLSVKGAEIQGIKSQIEQLESGQGEAFDAIQNEILQSRQESRINLENKKTKLEGIQKQLLQVIQRAYDNLKAANPNSTESIEEFTDKARSQEKFGKAITDNESALAQVSQDLQTFDQETKNQVQTAIQTRLEDLQGELIESQANYAETGAEENDKKVLLEIELKGQLTDPDNLFSDNNIEQIFATYGLKEGRDRLQQLRTESNEARERTARDEIRADIMSNVNWAYTKLPELANALSADIQTKLESLQQSNTGSETINTALSLEGTAKLDYLTESKDSQLNALAFWNNADADIDQVLSEYPQFAQYVAKETDKRYAEQQTAIKEGRLGGRVYLNSESDKQLQQEIDSRIEYRTNRYKSESISNIRSEISGIVDNEPFFTQDKQDQLMVAGRDQFGEIGLVTEANSFKAELSQFGTGIVLSAEGSFEIAGENPISQNSELAQQKNTIESQVKQSLAAEGYNINKIEDIDTILSNIQADIDKENNKILFKDKNKVTTLTVLKANIESQRQQYNQLQEQIDTNIRKFDEIRVNITELNSLYKKLPQYIQNKLRVLQDKSISNIAVTIDAAVQELQSYETPAELKAQRDKIAELQKQIEELEGIK
jgi:hypothetical protein